MSTINATPNQGIGLNLLNTLTTAAGRLPSLLISSAGVIGTGELAVRFVSIILSSTVGWTTAEWGSEAAERRRVAEDKLRRAAPGSSDANPPQQNKLEKVTSWIYAKTHINIRPFKDKDTLPLLKGTIAAVGLGILLNEALRILAGPAPQIYNDILSFIGPVRIDSKPYLENVQNVFDKFRNRFNAPIVSLTAAAA